MLTKTRLSHLLLSLSALALLTGCDQKGTESAAANVGTTPDPRMLKNFDVGTPWFCTIKVEYSENDATVSKLLISTGKDRVSSLKGFTDSCAASNKAAKSLCTETLKSGDYPCVHASMFVSAPPTSGVWRCEMNYTAGEAPRNLLEAGHTTANEAIEAAFKKCAELKDAEGTTTVERDACATAMMDKKMVCTDLNALPPIPVKPTPIRRVFRERRH